MSPAVRDSAGSAVDVAAHAAVPGLANLLSVIRTVCGLLEDLQGSHKPLELFSSFLSNTARVIEGLRYLPERAAPIVRHLTTEVTTCHEKVRRYKERHWSEAAFKRDRERDKLARLQQQMQTNLMLLSLTQLDSVGQYTLRRDVLLAHGAAAKGESAEPLHRHLERLERAMDAIANQALPAEAVAQAIEPLHSKLAELSEDAVRGAAAACLNTSLPQLLGHLQRPLQELRNSAERSMAALLEGQEETRQVVVQVHETVDRVEMRQDQYFDQVKQELQRLAGVRSGQEEYRDETVEQGVVAVHFECPQGVFLSPAAVVEQLVKLARGKRLTLPACMKSGILYDLRGPQRPTLLSCGCTMALKAAQQSKQIGLCGLCGDRLKGSREQLLPDANMLAMLSADRYGTAVPVIDPERLCVFEGELIGQGGEGGVHLGTLDGRSVAVKECRVVKGPEQARIVELAMRAAALMHRASQASPRVCQVHGVSWQPPRLRVVMERCERSLFQAVRARDRDEGVRGLPKLDCLVLLVELCDALEAVHSLGVVHSDVKPENVLLRPDGTPVLADFGIARRLPYSDTDAVTFQGSGAGTPAYAPLEQLDGMSAPTPASDVYALGATLIFAFSSRQPFGKHSGNSEFVRSRLKQGLGIEMPEAVPWEVQTLLGNMVHVEAAARPAVADIKQAAVQLLRAAMQPTFVKPAWGGGGLGPILGIPSLQEEEDPMIRVRKQSLQSLGAVSAVSSAVAQAEDSTQLASPYFASPKAVVEAPLHVVGLLGATGTDATEPAPSDGGGAINATLLPGTESPGALQKLLDTDALVDLHELREGADEQYLDGHGLFALRWTVKRVSEGTRVWELCGHHTTSLGGSLKLPEDGMLLLQHCRGVTLREWKVSGGTLVAYGTDCDVTLDNCQLECSVLVVAGAMATLKKCTHFDAGVALFATGRGTVVNCTEGRIQRCKQGVCAAAGALVKLEVMHSSEVAWAHIEARGRGSVAEAFTCRLGAGAHDTGLRDTAASCEDTTCDAGVDEAPMVHGAIAHGGGQLIMRDCVLHSLAVGAVAHGARTSALATKCAFRGMCGAGVAALSGSQVRLEQCEIRHTTPNQAITGVCGHGDTGAAIICGMRTNVAVAACTLEGNGTVVMADGAVECHLEGGCSVGNEHGIEVLGSHVLAEGFESRNDGFACQLHTGTAVLVGCKVAGAADFGVRASDDLWLVDCEIDGCGKGMAGECDGLVACDSAQVLGTNCTFKGNSGNGCCAFDHAQVYLRDCNSCGNGLAAYLADSRGAAAEGRAAALWLTNCRCSGDSVHVQRGVGAVNVSQ